MKASMRTASVFLILTWACCAGSILGTWRMDPRQSTFAGQSAPNSLLLRIERHAKGEVFTVDRVESDGRRTSSSTVLYLDGALRAFQDFECSGSQSSRGTDSNTVEIVRNCELGHWIRLTRKLAGADRQLVLEITEQYADGRRFERRLVFEKVQE